MAMGEVKISCLTPGGATMPNTLLALLSWLTIAKEALEAWNGLVQCAFAVGEIPLLQFGVDGQSVDIAEEFAPFRDVKQGFEGKAGDG